jgi:hypothetical protein
MVGGFPAGAYPVGAGLTLPTVFPKCQAVGTWTSAPSPSLSASANVTAGSTQSTSPSTSVAASPQAQAEASFAEQTQPSQAFTIVCQAQASQEAADIGVIQPRVPGCIMELLANPSLVGGTSWPDIIDSNNGTLTTFTTTGFVTTGNHAGGTASLQFDGSASYVDCGNNADINDLGPLTIAFWAFWPAAGTTANLGTVAYKSDGNNQAGWFVTIHNNIIFKAVCSVGDVLVQAILAGVGSNTWHHIIITWNGVTNAINTGHIYLDGVELGYQTNSAGSGVHTTDAAQHLLLGKDGGGAAGFYTSYLDDFRIFPRVLSAGEVTTLYGVANGTLSGTVGSGGIQVAVASQTLADAAQAVGSGVSSATTAQGQAVGVGSEIGGTSAAVGVLTQASGTGAGAAGLSASVASAAQAVGAASAPTYPVGNVVMQAGAIAGQLAAGQVTASIVSTVVAQAQAWWGAVAFVTVVTTPPPPGGAITLVIDAADLKAPWASRCVIVTPWLDAADLKQPNLDRAGA